VRDVEARDRYDRLLAYVYRASDGLFVNLAMVTDGYADQYTFPPNVAHVDEFRTAASTAREAGTGLWSACERPFEE
jgi:micrococcal nuclease